jgi:hypothetical protein
MHVTRLHIMIFYAFTKRIIFSSEINIICVPYLIVIIWIFYEIKQVVPIRFIFLAY